MAFLRGVSEGRNIIRLDAIFLKEGLVTGQIHEILMCNMHHDIKKGQREATHFFSRSFQGRWPARRYQGPAGGRSNIISHGSAGQSSADDCIQNTQGIFFLSSAFICQVSNNNYCGRVERNCRSTCEREVRGSLLAQGPRDCFLPSSLFLLTTAYTTALPRRFLNSYGYFWRLSGHNRLAGTSNALERRSRKSCPSRPALIRIN